MGRLDDKMLIESFDISSKPTRKTKNEARLFLKEYLSQKYSLDVIDEMIDNIYKAY
jgi:hypothetical protein